MSMLTLQMKPVVIIIIAIMLILITVMMKNLLVMKSIIKEEKHSVGALMPLFVIMMIMPYRVMHSAMDIIQFLFRQFNLAKMQSKEITRWKIVASRRD